MRRIKKLLILFTFVIVLLTFLHPVTTYASSKDNVQIQKQVKKFFNATKTQDIAKLKKLYKKGQSFKYCSDKHLAKVMKRMQKENLTYSINKIKVKKNNATVYVKVVYYNAYDDMFSAFDDMIIDFYEGGGNKSKVSFKNWAKYLKYYYEENREELTDEEWIISAGEESYGDEYDDYLEEYNEIKNDFVSTYCARKTIKIPMVKIGKHWYVEQQTKDIFNMSNCHILKAHAYIIDHYDTLAKKAIIDYIFG